MDDDKNKAGVLPGGDANKRTPPTIDLAASEVTESPRVSEAHEPAPIILSPLPNRLPMRLLNP